MTQWDDPRRQQPQHGQQPQYGQRPPGYSGPPANPFGTEGDEQFGIVGMVLGLLGGIILIVSFTGLDWFKGGASFSDVHDQLDANSSAPGFATAYFGWFAWAFLIIAVLAAVASSFPSPALRVVRVVGVVAGLAAAGLSFLAIQLSDQIAYTEFLKNARIGFYLAIIGFVLAGIGAAIGPRKV